MDLSGIHVKRLRTQGAGVYDSLALAPQRTSPSTMGHVVVVVGTKITITSKVVRKTC